MGRQFKPGQLQTGSLYNISSSYAVTASFALNGGGTTINTGSFVTTSSFNAFTASYTTGSFTGSFTGDGSQLTGIVSSKWTGSNPISRQSDVEITGSLRVQGSITGSLFGTASWATNAITSSFVTASNVYGPYGSNSITSASYAATASYSKNIQISGSVNNVDYIDFNTGSATPAWKSGRVFWDNTDGALSVYNAEADITLQVGQENWTRVSNRTGTTITNGTVVRLIGAHGDVPEVERAQSLLVSGSINVLNQILGVATHDIEDNSKGFVTTQGLVRGLNTSAFNDGDTLFVGTGSAGVLQNVPPNAPYEIIPVGVCVKAGPGGSGMIYVAVQEPIDFSDLSSVLVEGIYHYGDLWTYVQSGSTGVWTHTNQLSGSYGLTGSLTATSFTGSLFGTASYATQALSASYAPDTTFPYTGSAIISGSLRITGSLNVSGSTTSTQIGVGAAPNGSTRLDVRAQGALSSDTVFRVRNSADSQNLMSITGDGRVAIGLNAQILGTTDAFKNVVIGGGAKDIAAAGVTENAVALGYNAVSNNSGTAIGANTSVTGIEGVAIGASAIAGISSTAIGKGARADATSGYQSLAIGFGARASALLSGIIAVGQSSYTNALGQTLAFCVDPSGANSQTMLLTNKANLVFRNSTQLTSGTHWDTTATNTLTIHSGSIPATTVSGAFQMYAATGSLTDNTRPHFRTSNGTTVWLGDESRLFNVTASRTIISSSQNTISGSSLTVYGSGSSLPVFTVQGSQGELFSVTDSLSGSLFSVNDISGLPILEVFSDNTTLMGNYQDPMLITTAKTIQTNSGSFVVYSLPTASYDTAFFEYSIRSGSNARAGTIMAIQSGSAVNFTETTTTDFGNTSAVSFGVFISGSNMALTGSSTSGAWTTKCIVRGI